MNLKEFCVKINMPQEVTEALSDERGEKFFFGFAALKSALTGALELKKEYRRRGIQEKIFFDTMGCFSRFVREYKESYGAYGFDRDWWTGRQLSLSLVRLGELEYEFSRLKGEKAISVHIPSDADLSPERVSLSLSESDWFMERYFPEYFCKEYFCESWLLSPALKTLLPPISNIVRFAERFKLIETNENATDYIQWVYKKPGLSAECFPENTSLQRNIKRYVLSGGKIGEATGVLKKG